MRNIKKILLQLSIAGRNVLVIVWVSQPNILKGPVLWNESVQQGVYYDFGKTIIKIMECIVTGAPLDLTQDYFSRARNHATQNILAIQFDRHLLPDL